MINVFTPNEKRKPRVRLMAAGECHNGQRGWHILVWSPMIVAPITIITVNKRRNEVIFHRGHAFDRDAPRLRKPGWRRIWAIVGEQHQ